MAFYVHVNYVNCANNKLHGLQHEIYTTREVGTTNYYVMHSIIRDGYVVLI